MVRVITEIEIDRSDLVTLREVFDALPEGSVIQISLDKDQEEDEDDG